MKKRQWQLMVSDLRKQYPSEEDLEAVKRFGVDFIRGKVDEQLRLALKTTKQEWAGLATVPITVAACWALLTFLFIQPDRKLSKTVWNKWLSGVPFPNEMELSLVKSYGVVYCLGHAHQEYITGWFTKEGVEKTVMWCLLAIGELCGDSERERKNSNTVQELS